MESVEERLARIEARNRAVELDKKWETSVYRRVLIILLTYGIVGTFLTVIHVDRPWISAFVPVIGFTLSTLTVQFAKAWWLKSR